MAGALPQGLPLAKDNPFAPPQQQQYVQMDGATTPLRATKRESLSMPTSPPRTARGEGRATTSSSGSNYQPSSKDIMLVLQSLSGQVKEQRDEQRDLVTFWNERLTATEKETARLHDRIEAIDKDGIQELHKQMRNMGTSMEQRDKNMEARMEDHVRKMEQRWAAPEKSVTHQKKSMAASTHDTTAAKINDLGKKIDDVSRLQERQAAPAAAGRSPQQQLHLGDGQLRTAAEWPVVIGASNRNAGITRAGDVGVLETHSGVQRPHA